MLISNPLFVYLPAAEKLQNLPVSGDARLPFVGYQCPKSCGHSASTRNPLDHPVFVFPVRTIPQSKDGNESTTIPFSSKRRNYTSVVSGEFLNLSFALIDVMNGVCVQPP